MSTVDWCGLGPAGSQDGRRSPCCDPALCMQGQLLWWPGSSRGAIGFTAFESPLILRFSLRKTRRTLRLLDFAATDNNSGSLGVALWPRSPQRSGLPRGLGSPGRPFCGRPGACVYSLKIELCHKIFVIWRGHQRSCSQKNATKELQRSVKQLIKQIQCYFSKFCDICGVC